jgi:EAL domain-containing protein (putative c-di-GMP-specific phosphodiesterase class I)
MKAHVEEGMKILEDLITISISIGVSFYPCDTTSLDELIAYADMAMYKAKAHKNVLYERFVPQFTEEMNQLHLLAQELKLALIKGAFYLVYHPIYDIRVNQFTKVEVLLRWRENVEPSIFIPLAERLGLIQEIGLWVLQGACEARLQLAKQLSHPVKFCINLSPRQIESPKLIQQFFSVLHDMRCPPEWLEFELTESALVDIDKAKAFIEQLQANHYTVAIDDFGTGFSSLNYLKQLPFNTLKIDKQFIQQALIHPKEKNIFEAIVHLGHLVQVDITVEGVETKAQYDLCVKENCHYLQGFYFSKPVEFSMLRYHLIT